MIPIATETDKKLRILDSARALMVRHGFQNITMDDVAKEARVAKGTLFLYYKNKDDLFTAVFAAFVDELGRTLDALLASDLEGLPLLAQGVRAVLACFEDNKDFMSQFGLGKFTACGARSCDKLMEKFRENHRRVALLIERSLGSQKPKWKNYQTSALFSLCRSAMMEKLMYKIDGPLVDETDKVVEFFLHGAGRRP